MGEREGSRAKQMKPGGRVGGVEKDVGYGVQNECANRNEEMHTNEGE